MATTFFSDGVAGGIAADSMWRGCPCLNSGSTGSLITGDNRLQVSYLRLLWRLE
ncbi:MAG: hypothetical protein HYR94_29695 [Chloroflexi bacterium]|nr:hypothetical protein [Chloroflexota bacterium]